MLCLYPGGENEGSATASWGGSRDTGKNSQVTERLGGELLLLLEGWGLTRFGAR